MEGIIYMNLIEIGLVVIEIRGIENSELEVPVNNTLVRHTAFLAADTRPCVLISYVNMFTYIFTYMYMAILSFFIKCSIVQTATT